MNSSNLGRQEQSNAQNQGNHQISGSIKLFEFESTQTNNQNFFNSAQNNILSDNNYSLGLHFTNNNNNINNCNNNNNIQPSNSLYFDRQNSNYTLSYNHNNYNNTDNNFSLFNLFEDQQDNLQIFSYYNQINANTENSIDDFEQMFGIDMQDQGQQYTEQHQMKINLGKPNISQLIYFPTNQNIGLTQERLINLVLINEKTGVKYAFDQISIPITDEKQYDVNEIIQMQLVRTYIDENTIISIKRSDINIYLGKYPITHNRLQYIENGLIQILFKNEHFNEMGNNCQNSSNSSNLEQDEEKRMEERTIKEALQLVKLWRDTRSEANKRKPKSLKMISLEVVANEAKQCKKKTLDYYFLELRKAEQYNFNFSERLNEKMGMLRQFNQDMQKKFGDKKPSKQLDFQLPEEFILPLDQELIEKLIKKAVPSSKTIRSNLQNNRVGGRSNAAYSEDYDDEEENEEERSNENKNSFEPLPKTKQIAKSKSDSPKIHQQRLEKPVKNIDQYNQVDSEEEEETKFDGSSQQKHQYFQSNSDQNYTSHMNAHRFNQRSSFSNPEDISNQNQRIEGHNNNYINQSRDRQKIEKSINSYENDIFNSKKENSSNPQMTMSTLFDQSEHQVNHNLMYDSILCKNIDNLTQPKIEDSKLYDENQFNILPPLSQIESIDISNPNLKATQLTKFEQY
ncbi:hypothetical protein ABPG72_018330 [Tetrahymena utriculariae]